MLRAEVQERWAGRRRSPLCSAAGEDAASERAWISYFPTRNQAGTRSISGCVRAGLNLLQEKAGERFPSRPGNLPWKRQGEAAEQGPRMRVWRMAHPARPPQGLVGCGGAGLGGGPGGGQVVQRGGLVPSPGAAL